MINLVLTTDKISLISSSAATLDVHCSGVDMTGSTGTPIKQNAAISSATTTDIVAAPASSHYVNVKTVNVRNKDASLSCDVTVQFNANGTLYELFKTTLQIGETLTYVEGIGWFVYRNTALLNVMLRVANDVTNATTSFADITGLTYPLLSGKKYAFEANLFHSTNATTTGAQFGVNIGAAPTALCLAAIQEITFSVTGAAYGSSAMVTARDTAAVVETTGPGTSVGLAILKGFIQPSADGTFAVRSVSEVAVAGGLVTKAGSWCRIQECNN